MAEAGCIIVDWGTTSLRAKLMSATGLPLDGRETGAGILSIKGGAFEDALTDAVGDWFEAHGPLPVFAIGMITSRAGWMEVPYVDAPAGIEELRAGARRMTMRNGAPITFLAGLRDPLRRPFPDVMRGEETQVVGNGLGEDLTLVVPGRHTKWARVEGAKIIRFQTYISGEMTELLTSHSFIAKAAKPRSDDGPNWEAFDRGASFAASDNDAADALLATIFSARTGMLDGKLKPEEIADYVCGLVIATEFCYARDADWFGRGDTIGIVGNDGLNHLYERVSPMFGLSVRYGRQDAVERGVLTIASKLL